MQSGSSHINGDVVPVKRTNLPEAKADPLSLVEMLTTTLLSIAPPSDKQKVTMFPSLTKYSVSTILTDTTTVKYSS